jgi:isopentenyldiphosphate isomerase
MQGLVEHELDHVFIGVYNGQIDPNPSEVSEYRWVEIASLIADLAAHPDSYAPWLGAILPVLVEHLPKKSEE